MRRSPIQRKSPLKRAEGPSFGRSEHPQAKPVSPRTCAHCGKPFLPFQSMQKVCATTRCAKGYATAKRKADEKAEREHTKARKEKIKTIPDLIREAQVEFNKFVRTRDAKKPCICCGKPLGDGDVGGGYDAGHYRSTGSAAHLRFNEDNCHAQRKHCNRYGAGRAVDYRIGLVARIGLARVEALEADNTPHKWTREELIGIRATYRAKLRELKKERA